MNMRSVFLAVVLAMFVLAPASPSLLVQAALPPGYEERAPAPQ